MLFGFAEVYHFAAGKLDWIAAGLPTEGEKANRPTAMRFARHDVPVCALDDRLRDVDGSKGLAVVVDGEGVVLGLLRAEQFSCDPDARVEDVMLCGPSTFRPYVPIEKMAEHMTKHDLETALITTSDGKLVGVLFREDAVGAASS